eukprot:3376110-Rhodomonas_salina.2
MVFFGEQGSEAARREGFALFIGVRLHAHSCGLQRRVWLHTPRSQLHTLPGRECTLLGRGDEISAHMSSLSRVSLSVAVAVSVALLILERAMVADAHSSLSYASTGHRVAAHCVSTGHRAAGAYADSLSRGIAQWLIGQQYTLWQYRTSRSERVG